MIQAHIIESMYKILILSGLVLLAACSTAPTHTAVTQNSKSTHTSSTGMVVTANPLASQAGAEVLRAGGSAVDAAIAIEAVLSLVEPQSSGLGGGGFMVHFDNQSNTLAVYDGRERAPSNISATQFLDEQGKSIGFINAKNSGLSTGVPGMVAMLALAHKDHGQLPWAQNFERAKQLAIDGFQLSPRLQNFLVRFGKYIPAKIAEGPLDARQYFFDEQGQPLPIGALRTNPAYAKTLELIAADPAAFYEGAIAQQIVEQVAKKPRAGSLSLEDMRNFKASKREALCKEFKGKQLCGPPPSSSWVAVGATLGLLEEFPPFSPQGAEDPANWVRFAQAQRLAYADRDFHVADNEFVDVPLEGLLNSNYLRLRATQATPARAKESLLPGNPWIFQAGDKAALGADATVDEAGTTHFVVVDAQGDVVSVTASVESIFGSTRMAGGMFLNNQLTDFSFRPRDEEGLLIANRIEPNKRPRSSMSPTIVLDENGEFLMATGSPGGNSIIAYTAKTLVGVLEWGLSPQQAVDLPNLVARGAKVRIEKDRAAPELIQGLRDYGFDVKESAGENSGLSVVVRKPDGTLEGGVDPRREGTIEIVEF